MADHQTEKSRYPSRYSPEGFVTAAQYIIELLCENKAKKYGTGELPIHFWRLEEWAAYFKSQMRAVHGLLKKYPEKAIIAAIKKKRHFTLRPKFVIKDIENEAKLLIASSLLPEKPIAPVVENPTVRERKDKLLEKFGDLDG